MWKQNFSSEFTKIGQNSDKFDDSWTAINNHHFKFYQNGMILSKASVIHILNAQVFKNNDATLKHNKQPTTWLPINQLEDFNIYS